MQMKLDEEKLAAAQSGITSNVLDNKQKLKRELSNVSSNVMFDA
jgi:hypothetical protein